MKNNTLPTKKMTMTIMYTGCYACTPNQEILLSHLLGSGAGREEPGIERWWGEVFRTQNKVPRPVAIWM